jgi:hypothetical protein
LVVFERQRPESWETDLVRVYRPRWMENCMRAALDFSRLLDVVRIEIRSYTRYAPACTDL